MKDGDLLLNNMVWFGICRTPEGIKAYTVGMAMYRRDEMEIMGAGDPPGMVAAFLHDVACHILSTGAVFHDGDTVGFTKDQALRVTRSLRVSVDGYTLKIKHPRNGG